MDNLKLIFLLISIFLLYQKPKCLAESITANSPRVVLHANSGGRGLTFTAVATNYPDLSKVDFDNKAQSACVLGTWIFYGSKNFANFSSGVTMQFSKGNRCFKFENLYEKVSSMRHAGSRTDYRLDYLDIYTGTFFTGAHLRLNVDIRDVTSFRILETNSAIVSGTSAWTLYNSTNYSGPFKCVTPQEAYLPRFYKNSFSMGGLTVRSIRKGCRPSI